MATLVASIVLAAGLQSGVAVRADSGGGQSSPCGDAGTEVPMLGESVSLGLPFAVDPATQQITLQNGWVCAGDAVQQALVVPAPDLQGADLSATADCPDTAGAGVPASLQCAALVEPVIAYSDPDQGASTLGLAVSLPMRLCLNGGCQLGARAEVATAVVSGMLRCTSVGAGVAQGGGHVACIWQGAGISVDGVPQPAPGSASTGPAAAAAWSGDNVDIGLVDTSGCPIDAADLASCSVALENPYAVVRENGGRMLYLNLAGHSTVVTLPRSFGACIQPHNGDHC